MQIVECFISGIGRPPGKMDTANFVLRQFNRQEQEEVEADLSHNYLKKFQKDITWLFLVLQLDHTFQTGLEAIRILLLEGFNKSATFVNTRKSMEQLS